MQLKRGRDIWSGRTCVLATMHQKERVIAPLLRRELGLSVVVPDNFDTDRFGTFTREIKRVGNQLDAARAKALAAMEVTGAEVGVASEGSFGQHPSLPFVQSNLEVVVLIDRTHALEIVGHHRSNDICVQGKNVTSPEEAIATARAWGFPHQGVILRQSEQSNRHIYKALAIEEDVRKASVQLLSRPFAKSVFIETDMRAHRCPARMKAIERATEDLVRNCKRACPRCAAPGFVIVDVVRGLQCEQCGGATDAIKEHVYSCKKCHYREQHPVPDTTADPSECKWCNP